MRNKSSVALISALFLFSTIFTNTSATPLITRTRAAIIDGRSPEFTGVPIPPPPPPPPPEPSIPEPPKPQIPTPSIPTPPEPSIPDENCKETIKPDKNGYVPPGTCNAYYNYYPSFGAAIAASALFGVLLLAHSIQAIVYKAGFCWVMIMGVGWEFGSYVSRVFGTRNQRSVGLITVSQILVLLAPLWVNAFIYMVLGRMIYFFHPRKSIWKIKPANLAALFVTLDIISFLVQLVGGGMAGPGQDSEQMMLGIHIYMGGIGLQQFFIVIFFALAIAFHRDMLKAERTDNVLGFDKARWRGLLYVLYGSLLAISARIIYRLVEFANGDKPSNPIPYTEAYMYVLDCMPMLISILLWNIVHPGAILRGPEAKLPQSWLSRKLSACCCCCCGSRRKEKKMKGQEIDAFRSQMSSRGSDTVSEVSELADMSRGYAAVDQQSLAISDLSETERGYVAVGQRDDDRYGYDWTYEQQHRPST
ncbi:hypothetical protein FQN50_008752 [Emmonsiellopsis sp. PD_5]|nr:hypothetical protein FQN50_008752 [Emmonsiellopsis sp. PD_5]